MSRDEELEVVKTAYFLQGQIDSMYQERSDIVKRKPSAPVEPIKPKAIFTKAQMLPYPEINPSIVTPVDAMPVFNRRGIGCILLSVALLAIFVITMGAMFSLVESHLLILIVLLVIGHVGRIGCWVGLALSIFDLIKYLKKKSQFSKNQKLAKLAEIEKIRNSTEYKLKCQEIDDKNRFRQEELDRANQFAYESQLKQYASRRADYEAKLNLYQSEILPAWNKELSMIDDAIRQTTRVLEMVYSKNIIPFSYRNLSALRYLTLYLSTSQSNLEYAIQRYDKEVDHIAQQRQIELAQAQLRVGEEMLKSHQNATWLNEQMLGLSEHGNDLLKSIDFWQKADIAIREYRNYRNKKVKH